MGVTNFSDQLRTGIGLSISFDRVLRKIYRPKYNEIIERGLSSKRYNEAARHVQKIGKPRNTCTKQLVGSIVSVTSCCIRRSEQLS